MRSIKIPWWVNCRVKESVHVEPVHVPQTYCLVACTASKLPHAERAEKLYTSDWFTKASAYARQVVQATGGRWWILSAKHGLVEPQEVLDPYDATWINRSKPEREFWANWVRNTLRSNGVQRGDTVIMLAGERYRQFLMPMLAAEGIVVQVPMAHLGIGRQLQWLTNETRHAG